MRASRWWPLLLLTTLSGCYDDIGDIQQFMESVKANTPARIPPLPELQPFVHIPYKSADTRSPFGSPRPEEIQEKFSQVQDCLSPDPTRQKEPLEKYALDNLKMRGTLGDADNVWALIEASDKTLHRITQYNYVGLFHGQVVQVGPTQIDILELVPDGAGCWKERTTVLQMAGPATEAGK
jgi:type IV pilus assembly protein PilP